MERLPSQGWPILRYCKRLACKHAFHMQINISRAHTPPTTSQINKLSQINPLIPHPHSCAPPNHSRTRYKTAQDSLYNPVLTEIIPTSQSQMLPCPFLPTEMIIKYLLTLFPCFPSASWPTLVLPHVALHGMPGLLLLKTCVYKNVFLHGSHIHVCVSYLKTIPEYILQQLLNHVGIAHLHHFHFLVPLYS